MPRGGQQSANFKVPAPGNGARTDLSGQQGIKVPTGLGYGEAGQLRQLQQQQPLPAAAPSSGPTPSSPQAPGPQPSLPPDVDSAVGLVSSHPTDFPNDTLAPQQANPTQSLAFKIDALRHLSSMPWAGPEITGLLKQAQEEYQNATMQKFTAPQQAQQPGSPVLPSTLSQGA